jgi:hypothetical protein
MNVFMSLYLAALFVALTPGVLLTLPKGAKLTVAVVHGLVFAVIYNFTYRMVWRTSVTMDGFQGGSAQSMLRIQQGSKPGQGNGPMGSMQNANLAQEAAARAAQQAAAARAAQQAAAARTQQQAAAARAQQATMAAQRAGSK